MRTIDIDIHCFLVPKTMIAIKMAEDDGFIFLISELNHGNILIASSIKNEKVLIKLTDWFAGLKNEHILITPN